MCRVANDANHMKLVEQSFRIRVMKNFLYVLFVVGLFTVAAPIDEGGVELSVRSEMGSLSVIYPELMSFVVNDDDFNKKRYLYLLKQFNKISNKIHRKIKSDNLSKKKTYDSSLSAISLLFNREADKALSAAKAGHIDYSKAILMSTSSHCISCHSSDRFGSDLSAHESPRIKKLHVNDVEKAKLYFALRKFDPALASFNAFIKKTKYNINTAKDFELAVMQSLLIYVRYLQQPNKALSFVKIAKKKLPKKAEFYKNIVAWEKSLKKWKKTFNHSASLKQITLLAADAKKTRKFYASNSALIEYLVLSQKIHHYLKKNRSAQQKSKAYRYLATSYEYLRSVELWHLHEIYYEKCIRIDPHSVNSLTCYKNLNDSVIADYSGSRGTRLPKDVKDYLDELKKLSHPKTQAQKINIQIK